MDYNKVFYNNYNIHFNFNNNYMVDWIHLVSQTIHKLVLSKYNMTVYNTFMSILPSIHIIYWCIVIRTLFKNYCHEILLLIVIACVRFDTIRWDFFPKCANVDLFLKFVTKSILKVFINFVSLDFYKVEYSRISKLF